ncbi:MAG: hypothetical protein JRN66_06445 [Nitrososphaerota archaeon]|jgi:hypothetical protein|nr:hypothetical protein [Nitrososphaerota archaeon]
MKQFKHRKYMIRIVEYGWSAVDKGARFGTTVYSRSINEKQLSDLMQKLTLLRSDKDDE